jgi:hypothetical protein
MSNPSPRIVCLAGSVPIVCCSTKGLKTSVLVNGNVEALVPLNRGHVICHNIRVHNKNVLGLQRVPHFNGHILDLVNGTRLVQVESSLPHNRLMVSSIWLPFCSQLINKKNRPPNKRHSQGLCHGFANE